MLSARLYWYLRGHKKQIILFLIITCLSVVYFSRRLKKYELSSSLQEIQCSRTESLLMIKDLCSLYRGGKVVGDMCSAMCRDQSIVFKSCFNYKDGKHVLLVDCVGACNSEETIQAVIKMDHLHNKDMTKHFKTIDERLSETFTLINSFDNDIHLLDHLIEYRKLLHEIKNMLFLDYGALAQDDEDLLGKLMGNDHTKYREMVGDDPAYPISFVRTLWSLLTQNEYKMSVVFYKWKIFPEIYGFCGPVYFSEYTPTDKRLNRETDNLEKVVWRKRVTIAVHILNLIYAADYLQTPLHFCDVKTPHFGFNADGEVRFIDSDTVFTNETLNKIFETSPCSSDEECRFFDCFGKCDSKRGKCIPRRVNTNLQCVCSKIFQDDKDNPFEGILANPPTAVAAQVNGLLQACVDGLPETGQSSVREWFTKTKKVLVDSIEYE